MTFWDDRFSAEEYAYGTEPNDFLREQAHHIPPGPVLCLAEGEGRNAVFLAQRGHPVTAVDGSGQGLEKARRLALVRQVTLTLHHADLAEYALEPNHYSGIICIFGHLPSALRARVLALSAAALQPGGVFIAEYYRPEQLAHGTGGPKDLDLLVPLAALQAELAGLEFVVAREAEREIHEGRLHTGLSATVQVVARRRA